MQPRWFQDLAQSWRHRRFTRDHAAERRRTIQTELGAARPGYVLLVGDSHAEMLGSAAFSGRICINIGVGGSTAGDCAEQLAQLERPERAAAAVLFIGSNDILRWRKPGRSAAGARFDAAGARIVGMLESWADWLLVAAVPPIGAAAVSRDPAGVIAFSHRLEALCLAGGHTFFDPFAKMREPVFGLARAGLHPDGVHMADYARLRREVVSFLDTRLALAGTPGLSHPALRSWERSGATPANRPRV